MKFPQIIEVYETTYIQNELGGYDKMETLFGKVKGLITVPSNDLVVEDGKIIAKTVTKFYTKHKMPLFADFIVSEEVRYKIMSFKDYGKIKVYEVEKVE